MESLKELEKGRIESLPPEYRPLSPWAYFGYNLLFAIPLVGLIFLFVFAFSDKSINRRNYARSFFCWYLLGLILAIILIVLGVVMFSAASNIAGSVY